MLFFTSLHSGKVSLEDETLSQHRQPIKFLARAKYSIRSNVSRQSFPTAGLESAARVRESLKTLSEDFKMICWQNMKRIMYTRVYLEGGEGTENK